MSGPPSLDELSEEEREVLRQRAAELIEEVEDYVSNLSREEIRALEEDCPR